MIFVLFLYGKVTNSIDRETNSLIYDYFMWPILNPRIGSFDIKFFFELRVGIMQWFFTTVAMALKMRDETGVISSAMILICFYHLCFVNACYKGEQCVPMSMDIIYEKFGWMLCFLDLVTVPFIFPLQAYYLYKIGPFEHSLIFTLFCAFLHIIGYWIFDTANSQKDYFREENLKVLKYGETGPVKLKNKIKKGFPILPWDKIDNPKALETQRGTKLLLSGWWGIARHMNYTGDLMMAWSWGLVCGFGSLFPYIYAAAYLTPLLLHREYRDNKICKEKYGPVWDEYCKRVPYRLIPGIY